MANNDAVQFGNINEAIAEYVKVRDELAVERKKFNEYEAVHKMYLEKISMWLRDKADDLGVDNFKTQSGTAFRTVKTSYRVAGAGWDEFIAWIQETGNFQCLEKRVAKNATKEIHDETGAVPPGIEYHADVEFDVRRPSK